MYLHGGRKAEKLPGKFCGDGKKKEFTLALQIILNFILNFNVRYNLYVSFARIKKPEATERNQSNLL